MNSQYHICLFEHSLCHFIRVHHCITDYHISVNERWNSGLVHRMLKYEFIKVWLTSTFPTPIALLFECKVMPVQFITALLVQDYLQYNSAWRYYLIKEWHRQDNIMYNKPKIIDLPDINWLLHLGLDFLISLNGMLKVLQYKFQLRETFLESEKLFISGNILKFFRQFRFFQVSHRYDRQ